ncbi:MAG: hypothetical protein KDK66_09390, partial [Deltaproteobacteria bacterium]|nr:hypothetical protein [Deltaproteobacteria bacterium]
PEGLGEKTVAICQTTITKEKFQHLVSYIREKKCPQMRAIDTRCKPVKNQQQAVEDLAQWVDAFLIIGGFNSSNTTNLANIVRKYLPDTTYHIDSPELIEPEWLKGVRHLGIGAGTSTPKIQINDVQQKIAEIYPGHVFFRKEGQAGEILDSDFTPEDEI